MDLFFEYSDSYYTIWSSNMILHPPDSLCPSQSEVCPSLEVPVLLGSGGPLTCSLTPTANLICLEPFSMETWKAASASQSLTAQHRGFESGSSHVSLCVPFINNVLWHCLDDSYRLCSSLLVHCLVKYPKPLHSCLNSAFSFETDPEALRPEWV